MRALVLDRNNSVRCISQALFVQVVLLLISFGFLVDLSTPALPSFGASNPGINNTATLGRIILEVPTFSCATILPVVFLLNEFIGLKITIWVGALARLASLATCILTEAAETADLFGCVLSGIAQATKFPFYCHIFRLLTKELHLNLFGLLSIWTLLGNAISNIVLHFLSADVDLQISTYLSIVPTITACLLVAFLVPFGNCISSPVVAVWPGHNHPEHGSPCTRLYWTRLASDIRSWMRTMLFRWIVWCAITVAVIYGLQANLAYFLAQSVHPSYSYGLLCLIAMLLTATITVVPNVFEPVEHYPVCLLPIAPLTLAPVICEILSDMNVENADTFMMYLSYACITYATSAIGLLCIAVKINTDVFRILFGLVMFVSLALQSVAEFAQKLCLIDADGLVYIYVIAQILLILAALAIVCSRGSQGIEAAPDEEESPEHEGSPYASPRSFSSLIP